VSARAHDANPGPHGRARNAMVTTVDPQKVPEVLAAVDLGSNSFHMVVARYHHGQLTILDRLREMVRLAGGLDDQGRLSREATDRALGALQRFGQRLRDMKAKSVRVVGTNAIRKARRKQGFLERAREALGHPIEIISGIEEARLIYQGVVHTMPLAPGRRLVVDIGGGSTECIVGEGYEHRILESLYLGCVSLSSEFFPDGRVAQKRWERAVVTAEVECEPMRAPFRAIGWEHAIGSSGSARAIAEVIRELDPTAQSITRDGAGCGRATPRRGRQRARGRVHVARRGAVAGVPGRPRDPAGDLQRARSRRDARGRRRAPRGPAVRHDRPLQRRGRARAQRALVRRALPRRRGAGEPRRGDGRRIPAAGGGPVGSRRAARGERAALGRAPARDRPRHLAPEPPQARGVPARERGPARAFPTRSRCCWRAWSAVTGAR
jgi:hypothetical protein